MRGEIILVNIYILILCVVGIFVSGVVVTSAVYDLKIIPDIRKKDVHRATMFSVYYYKKHGYWPSYWHQEQLIIIGDKNSKLNDSLLNIK